VVSQATVRSRHTPCLHRPASPSPPSRLHRPASPLSPSPSHPAPSTQCPSMLSAQLCPVLSHTLTRGMCRHSWEGRDARRMQRSSAGLCRHRASRKRSGSSVWRRRSTQSGGRWVGVRQQPRQLAASGLAVAAVAAAAGCSRRYRPHSLVLASIGQFVDRANLIPAILPIILYLYWEASKLLQSIQLCSSLGKQISAVIRESHATAG